MRPKTHWRVWGVVGLGIAAACATTDTGAQTVMKRMAEEYDCHQGEMTVTAFTANGYRVTGCGYTASYSCVYGSRGSFTCSKEADSSPLPESGPPPPPFPDAGPH